MRKGIAALLLAAAGCAVGTPMPAALDTRNDPCRHCRMAVSDRRFAAQVVAPGEEPVFFDDIGCLRDWIAAQPALPGGATAFVSDHRTSAWVEATTAVYTRNPAVQTPMASGLLAHRDAASREQDAAARGGEPVRATDLLGRLVRARE